MPPRVSLSLIAKNEEANLPACLDCVAGLVDEIIVVDTGSTDRTKEVAARYRARVFDFPWVDSFAAARNETLQHATGEWIFWLDADDRIDEENRGKLRALFAGLGNERVAYEMSCVLAPGTPGGAAVIVDHIRLFRHGQDVRWRYRVHEQVRPAILRRGDTVRRADVAILHTGYQDADVRRRKEERNLRLLLMDHAEQPDNPVVLFHLAKHYLGQGQPAQALPLFERSLQQVNPGDADVRKLYTLTSQTQRRLGRMNEALAVCRQGLHYFPDDPELLSQEAYLLFLRGDLAGSEASLLRLLNSSPGDYVAIGVDPGLRTYKARYSLGIVYRDTGRPALAEEQFRQALAEQPGYTEAWMALADLYLSQGRWSEVELAAESLSADPSRAADAAVLQARVHMARREFADARRVLGKAIADAPRAIAPRVALSHVLVEEGTDTAATEQALRDVLALDPGNHQAQENLRRLLAQRESSSPAPSLTPPLNPSPNLNPTLALASNQAAEGAREGVRVGVGTGLRAGEGSRAGLGASPVSLCMIVKNEEANLSACLDCVAGLVKEIIIVDTGSTDRTKEFAGRYGATVFDFPWADSFAAARNEGLRHATGEWIFWLDADDRLDEENRRKLAALLAGLKDENVGYTMRCRSRSAGVSKVAIHGRLFRRRPDICFHYRVHEQILPAIQRSGGTLCHTAIVIDHVGYEDPAMVQAKSERNLRLLQLDLADNPDDPVVLFNLGKNALSKEKPAEALPYFQQCRTSAQPDRSWSRDLYDQLAQCHRQLGQEQEALAACQEGLARFPDAIDLRFQEALWLFKRGDLAGAESRLRGLLGPQSRESLLFCVDPGRAGYLARYNLGVVVLKRGQPAVAEAEWLAVLRERPDYAEALIALGGLYVAQRKWDKAEEIIRRLEANPQQAAQASALRAKMKRDV
jgi:glycosyltransferase involved in cell wall biosynthesis/Tfp pilus assembly protein PilF